jgi:hypothetical protein
MQTLCPLGLNLAPPSSNGNIIELIELDLKHIMYNQAPVYFHFLYLKQFQIL